MLAALHILILHYQAFIFWKVDGVLHFWISSYSYCNHSYLHIFSKIYSNMHVNYNITCHFHVYYLSFAYFLCPFHQLGLSGILCSLSVTLCGVTNQLCHLDPNGCKGCRQKPLGINQKYRNSIMLFISSRFQWPYQFPVNISYIMIDHRHWLNTGSSATVKHCFLGLQLGEKHLFGHIQQRGLRKIALFMAGFH